MTTEYKAPAARLDYLLNEIYRHRALYYHGSDPEISDEAYDSLEDEIRELLKKLPKSLIPETNPLAEIGVAVSDTGFVRQRHRKLMGSLEKVRNRSEALEFIKGVERYLRLTSTPVFNVEPKLDGLSSSITYEHGHLVRALTRGDGTFGEDVTANVRLIKDVPLQLQERAPPRLIEVRGEVLIKRADFEELNQHLTKAGKKPFASCRNAAAGSLRQIDPTVTGARPLVFRAFALGETSHKVVDQHSHLIRLFTAWGFKVTEPWVQSDSLSEIEQYVAELEQQRAEYPFDLDGVVCKVDDIALQDRLGVAGRAPRWAVAWKFQACSARTRVKTIQFQVSRLGHLTPVANLNPVQIDGVTITRASLHNIDEIERLDIRINDDVTLQRSGDVIPQIKDVHTELRSAASQPLALPEQCPSCASDLIRVGGFLRCFKGLACPEQRFETLNYIISRPALDIRGFGAEHLRLFMAKDWIQQPADLFNLEQHRDDIVNLPGWGKKSWTNLAQEIQRARCQPLPKAFYSLGIPLFGTELTRRLARIFRDYTSLRDFALQVKSDPSTAHKLTQFDGFGDRHVAEIRDYFADQWLRESADALILHLTIAHADEVQSTAKTDLTGKTILFSGALNVSRQEAKDQSEKAGARVVSAISQKIDYLILGEGSGGKKRKAEALGLAILDEDAWRKMLEPKVTEA